MKTSGRDTSLECCHFTRQAFKVLSFDFPNGQKGNWGTKTQYVSTMMSLEYARHYVLKFLYKFYKIKIV